MTIAAEPQIEKEMTKARSARGRRWLAISAVTILVPVLLVALTELTLRVCGVGTSTTVTRPCTDHGQPAYCDNPNFAATFFPAGMFRTPRAGVEFGDVSLIWYANQGDQPLVSPLGQQQDHIALSVADLDAWIDKLKGEGVKFLDGPYKLGPTRAVMIEGPSLEAIELVEVK